ncbi:MAG: hypothetical protein L6R48_11580 [Planctomycetes bacterium]|nr:hypothetical protein [Planctomycetota bacterium]
MPAGAALAVGLAVVAVLAVDRGGHPMLPREALTAADLRALPADLLLVRSFDRLRWHVALDPARLKRWRAQPDSVRHLLVLSTVETDAGLAANTTFPGLASLFAQGAFACSAQELAEAYRAIGATGCAMVADAAAQADGDAKRLAACDRRLVAASEADGTVARMRAFVRERADELDAYWARP